MSTNNSTNQMRSAEAMARQAFAAYEFGEMATASRLARDCRLTVGFIVEHDPTLTEWGGMVVDDIFHIR